MPDEKATKIAISVGGTCTRTPVPGQQPMPSMHFWRNRSSTAMMFDDLAIDSSWFLNDAAVSSSDLICSS
jgi:hypothetical protein